MKFDINIPTILYYDPSPVVIDDERFDGGWYIQKYISGFVLSKLDNKNNQYIRHAFLLIIDALEKIHNTGFIHGDAHGGNFIYSPNECKIYVIDFELTYSYVGDAKFHPESKEDTLNPEVDTFKIMMSFLSCVSGKPFWSNKFGKTILDPRKNICNDFVNAADMLTENTTLEEFKSIIQNIIPPEMYQSNL